MFAKRTGGKENKEMTERRKMDLKNSIENSANFVSANMGAETVVGILKMHNAESIDDLCV